MAMIVAFGALTAYGIIYNYYSSSTYRGWEPPGGNVVNNISNCSVYCGVYVGQQISNFYVETINASNDSVYGLLYYEYPVARIQGYPATLYVGNTIGYACDGSEYQLVAVKSNPNVTIFVHNSTDTGKCPT
ncbi:MAG: hypothetical protein M1504_00785 [Candidatus Marsarchaeota archaeon]|nr:hypothetical protein [Candidatus Marsarchaeota archaeon]